MSPVGGRSNFYTTLRKRCTALVDNGAISHYGNQIREKAQQMSEDGCQPSFFMIDGDHAERLAIKAKYRYDLDMWTDKGRRRKSSTKETAGVGLGLR